MSRIPKKYKDFFLAAITSYGQLSADSRNRTSLAAWVALKLGISTTHAQAYIDGHDGRSIANCTDCAALADAAARLPNGRKRMVLCGRHRPDDTTA